jgi:hypothetical protein
MKDFPDLKKTWRFHIDTWCLQAYYPSCGDAGNFAKPIKDYPALELPNSPRLGALTFPRTALAPSQLLFLYRLYQATEDPAYVQLMVMSNNGLNDLPQSLSPVDSKAIQKDIAAVIDEHGSVFNTQSKDFKDWHLALQRSGKDQNERVLWLAYDNRGMHGHNDALNLGLFSHQLDMLPDWGYPPLGFSGGWQLPKANWYLSTAGHNAVLVDREDQNVVSWKCLTDQDYICEYDSDITAETTLWIDESDCHGMRCRVNAYSQCSQYDRLAVMIDIDESRFYILDIFRVIGGSEHVKFTHTQFADLATPSLNLTSSEEDFGPNAQMRNFQWDSEPGNPWSADWTIDDKYGAGTGDPVHMRYTDLTTGAVAGRHDAWIAWGEERFPTRETWIPRIMVKREGENLQSCFVSILEPYADTPAIASVTRTSGEYDLDVELTIRLTDGRTDHILAPNTPNDIFTFTR